MKVECDAYYKCYITSTIDSVHYGTTSMSHSPHSTPALSAFVRYIPSDPPQHSRPHGALYAICVETTRPRCIRPPPRFPDLPKAPLQPVCDRHAPAQALSRPSFTFSNTDGGTPFGPADAAACYMAVCYMAAAVAVCYMAAAVARRCSFRTPAGPTRGPLSPPSHDCSLQPSA